PKELGLPAEPQDGGPELGSRYRPRNRALSSLYPATPCRHRAHRLPRGRGRAGHSLERIGPVLDREESALFDHDLMGRDRRTRRLGGGHLSKESGRRQTARGASKGPGHQERIRKGGGVLDAIRPTSLSPRRRKNNQDV